MTSECTWPQLVQWLREQSTQVIADPFQRPMIGFTRFIGGVHRHELDPKGLWALALDFDHVPVSAVAELILAARALAPGPKLLAHTTWRHGTIVGEARLRVIYPSDEPLPPAHYVEAWAEAVREFAAEGHEVDPQTGNPERCWYVPAVNPNAPEWAQVPWVQEFDKL